MSKDILKDLIDAVNICNNLQPEYTLFLPREPQGYVKEFIEEQNLKYEIIRLPESCGIDMNTVLVVPDNLYKPIKICLPKRQ